MLNKQGLFSRGSDTASSNARVATPSSTLSANHKSVLMPGHQAALESATPVSIPSVVETAKKESVVKEVAGSRLIVGPDVKLKGAEIQDCDTLVVEGRVEATMDSRVIQITEHGAFSGKVGIDVAEVFGHFDGELTARTQLIIHASGRVSGKIRYGSILIEEGGELSGDIASLSADTANKKSGGLALGNSVIQKSH